MISGESGIRGRRCVELRAAPEEVSAAEGQLIACGSSIFRRTDARRVLQVIRRESREVPFEGMTPAFWCMRADE